MPTKLVCECGLTSHEDQITELPINTVVEAKIEIKAASHLAVVPPGTKGIVTAHAEDGRAWIFFKGNTGAHRFHYPDAYIFALGSEERKLRRMLITLIDAHYGAALHHIGDGDGIPEKEAKEIRIWWKNHLDKVVADWKASQGEHQNA